MKSWQVNVFGVRHLSPMGAWQLRQYLSRVQPEVVLIEELTDATELISDITRKGTKPPIAILAYTDSLPVRTLVYPLANYSPEYQGLLWAKENGAKAEFIDLPAELFLGLQDLEAELMEKARQAAEEKAKEAADLPPLPLGEGRGEGISPPDELSDPHPNPLPRGEGTDPASAHAPAVRGAGRRIRLRDLLGAALRAQREC